MLADPRLVAAREVLGGALVKQAVTRAQDLARSGAISPAGVADADCVSAHCADGVRESSNTQFCGDRTPA